MPLYLFNVFGSASIGVYVLATDEMVIVPKLVSIKKAERIRKWLKVQLIHTTIGDSVLVGALACANSNGLLLPHFVREEELQAIKTVFKATITIMDTKKNTFGNMVLANDYGAIVDPSLSGVTLKQISETLGVEAVPGKIAGLPYTGSVAVATNKGVLAHPLLKNSERKLLDEVLKVPIDIGTINCGIPYVGTGLVGNRHAAVSGSLVTGPEIFIIENALDVVKENDGS